MDNRVVPQARPQFYLGGNKRPIGSEEVVEEERKMFGIEKYINRLRQPKRTSNIVIDGIDLASLGLKLNSPE